MQPDVYVPARLDEALDEQRWSEVEVMNGLERLLRDLYIAVRRSRSFRRAALLGVWHEQEFHIGGLFAALQLGDDDQIVLTLSRWRNWGAGLRLTLTLSRNPASPWEARVESPERIDPPVIRELAIPGSRIVLTVMRSGVLLLQLAPPLVAICVGVYGLLVSHDAWGDILLGLLVEGGALVLVSRTLTALRSRRHRDPRSRRIVLPEYAALRSALADDPRSRPTSDGIEPDWTEPACRAGECEEKLRAIALGVEGADREYRQAMLILGEVRERAVCRWRVPDELDSLRAVEAWQEALVRACRLVAQSDALRLLLAPMADKGDLQAAIKEAVHKALADIQSERHTREETIQLIVALLGIAVTPRAERRQAWCTAWVS